MFAHSTLLYCPLVFVELNDEVPSAQYSVWVGAVAQDDTGASPSP